MSDSTILYVGIICFSLIILGFALTALAFSRNAGSSASSKRKPHVAYRT